MKTAISIGILAGTTFWGYHKLLVFMHNEPSFLLYLIMNMAIIIGLFAILCFALKNGKQWLQTGACLVLLCIAMKILSLLNWPLLVGIDDIRSDELVMVAVYYAGIISFIISPFYVGWQLLPKNEGEEIAKDTPVSSVTSYFFISCWAGLTFAVLLLLFSCS